MFVGQPPRRKAHIALICLAITPAVVYAIASSATAHYVDLLWWPAVIVLHGYATLRYYDWAARSPSQRSQTNTRLATRIRESFAASDCTYGSPRVWRDLQDWGETCSENRVAA